MGFKKFKKLAVIFGLLVLCSIVSVKNVHAVGCSTYRECPNYAACVNNVCQDVATICSLEPIFNNVVGAAGALVGFAFFVMLIMGGIRLLMSGGDPKAVAAAKGTLTWAIAGLAFFALSFTILLLIEAFTGVTVTKFQVCS
jgi:Type IV secretion system pilin